MTKTSLILLGFGNVGCSFAKLIEEHRGFAAEGIRLELDYIFDRKGGVNARGHTAEILMQTKVKHGTVSALDDGSLPSLLELLDADDDYILVDASSTNATTGEPGLTLAQQAVRSGHSVVFASKGPLVAGFQELIEQARINGARLGISAAVGIPLPTIEVGLRGLAGAGLDRFRGVFNDTANQVLRQIEAGNSLQRAVEKAKKLGIIEADPSLDLDGWDAAYKALILARSFWDPEIPLSDAIVRGVQSVTQDEIVAAAAAGTKIRLIATAERSRSRIQLSVQPEVLVPKDPLYALDAGEKGVVFDTKLMGTLTLLANKGGPKTTAASVVKDVLNIVKGTPLVF